MSRIHVLVCLGLASLYLTIGCASPSVGLSDQPIRPIDSTTYVSTPVSAKSRYHRPGYQADLRVMSFNIRQSTMIDLNNHWELRKGLAAETIRAFNPDLLGTQECEATQAEDLGRMVEGYSFVGAGRNDGRRGGEMCAIFFKTAKFSKLDEGHFWLSKNPTKPGSKSWGNTFPRMVSWVKLRPRGGGESFYFFNTHLDINGGARLQEARMLREEVTRIARTAPVVVTGDFNDGENTAPYRVMTGPTARGGMPLVDTLRSFDPTAEKGEGTRHGFRGGRGGDRMDWILATRHFDTLQAAIDRNGDGFRYPSDHYPVTAVVRMKPTLAAQAQATPRG